MSAYPGLDRSKFSGTPPYPKSSVSGGPQIALLDAAPPSALTPETFAARLYALLEPLAQLDADAGWSLLILCNAIGAMFQEVEDWVRDTPAGPGWSLLLDLTRCPDEALGWLAQFVGVRLLPGMSADDQRAFIASTDGWRRGTRASMIGAAQSTLTGAQTVVFRERDHDPSDSPDYAYYLTAYTYTDQTPDSAATLRALLAQKPGGIVLTYTVADGQDYALLKSSVATYAIVKSTYSDYLAVKIAEV